MPARPTRLIHRNLTVAVFQLMDACNDGVIDAAHSVPVYWCGKSKAASLFGTAPVWGGNATTMMGWFYQGGGAELYRELTLDILGGNQHRVHLPPDSVSSARNVLWTVR